jgi:hypothetical protein
MTTDDIIIRIPRALACACSVDKRDGQITMSTALSITEHVAKEYDRVLRDESMVREACAREERAA